MIAITSWTFFASAAKAMPPQPGFYSWASKYIQIAKKGDRLCYQGFSSSATMVASVQQDAENPSLYRLHTLKDAALKQDKPDEILYGAEDNLLPYAATKKAPQKLSAEMQRCLNSKKPFIHRKDLTRQQ